MPRRFHGAAALFFLLFSFLVPPKSWSADISIAVVDSDLDLPLEGVRLQANGIDLAVTDGSGHARMHIDENASILVTAILPGYEPAKAWVKSTDNAVNLRLTIATVIEGEGLVVERPKPDKTDAAPAVSQVATKQDITNTGEIGFFEDVMTTIRLLPGVGYNGSWTVQPSIRGGDPAETKATLDGTSILYPFHWGGGVSIFNPAMVDTAKLSNGIISARYGQVISGLLEVNSKMPSLAEPHYDFSFATTGIDSYVQAPLSRNAGLLAGGKVTWMEVPFALMGQSKYYDVVPYIRDGYARISWNPADAVKCYANFFVGSDGVAQNTNSSLGALLSAFPQYSWETVSFFGSAGVQISIGLNQLFTITAAYNNATINESSSNDLGDWTSTYSYNLNMQSYEGKIEWDWQFGDGQLISLGLGTVYELVSENEREDYWAYLLMYDGYHYSTVALK